MSGSAAPGTILLQDYSPVREGQDLCRAMQEKIRLGQCCLIDLLEPEQVVKRSRSVKDIQLVEPWGRELYTKNYVGLFQLDGARVIITSRFDRSDHPYFLYHMLETCWDASFLALEDVGAAYAKSPFDMLLAARLAVQLNKAWKRGALRAYRTFAHNDSHVQGQIDIPRHIRENLGLDNGKIAYRTRSYSLDNDYNILFLQACDAIGRRQPGLLRRLAQCLPEFHAALRTLRQEIPGWAHVRQDVLLHRTEKKIVNPIFRDYEPARIAARAILRRMGTDPSDQARDKSVVTGVFLDIDDLWERFLARALFHAPRSVCQRDRPAAEDHLLITPDFYWEDRHVVLDAKNRSAWGDTLDQQLWHDVNDDIYQVHFYMQALNCPDGGVVFPVAAPCPNEPFDPASLILPLNGGRFWRLPVHIPTAASGRDFARQLNGNLAKLKQLEVVSKLLP